MDDRLQPGIYWKAKAKPPPYLRILLLNVGRDASAEEVIAALSSVNGSLLSLKRGHGRDLLEQRGEPLDRSAEQFSDLDVLWGYGRRLFDVGLHRPGLVRQPRPSSLSYVARSRQPFPAISWTGSAEANRGEADLLLQFTAGNLAAVSLAAVEVWKVITDRDLPLQAQFSASGYGRTDGRGWLEFHDGVSNLPSGQRRQAIEAGSDPAWMAGGTYMAFLRFAVDLAAWRRLIRAEQELLIGRDKLTGAPLVAVERGAHQPRPVPAEAGDGGATDAGFRDPPETTDPLLEASHVHRANQSRASPDAPAALRIFRQGYDYLDQFDPSGPSLGLNFISFQGDLGTIQHLLHLPSWLGGVNFGGPENPGPGNPPALELISLVDGGFYAVPPRGRPFPGVALFS